MILKGVHTAIRTIIMNIDRASQSLIRLMTWLSPAFPIGGFSYSHGLEAAIANKLVSDRQTLKDWLSALIGQGSIWNDCVFLALSCTAGDEEKIAEYNGLAQAMAGSHERYLETMSQGKAFMQAVGEWAPQIMHHETLALPVGVGVVAHHNEIAVNATLTAYLQSFTSNQIQAALRLMRLGQANGLWVQHQMEPLILKIAGLAADVSIVDLGSNTYVAEISAMQHETLAARIFRT